MEPDHLKQIEMFADEKHSNGNAVVARQIIALLLDKFGLMIHRRTVGRLMRKLGLNYSAIKPVKRIFAAHRRKVLREYLIELDGYERRMKNNDSEYVYVFTDESYVNTGHGMSKSYIPSDKAKECKIHKKSGKGRRLIILHAITVDGPLAEKDEDGKYIDKLQ